MKSKNTMVGILAAVLVVALWYTMVLKPQRAKASKVREDTASQRSTLDPLEAQLVQARRDAADAATFKAQLDSLEQAMPDSPALAAFIRDANQIADETGVAWNSVTHGPPTLGTDSVTSITLGIQVKGSYAQTMDYLAKLGELKRLVVVDGVQFSTAASTGASSGGSGGGGGETTGPFSGSSQLAASITARMFEAPGAVLPGAATGTGTGVATPAPTGAAPATGNATTVNNS